MLVLYIFILMFTNSINHLQKNIHSTYINRITIITLLISILFTFNTLYFQSIGKGISLYSGLYQTTVQSHIAEILLLIVGISILLGWPNLASSGPASPLAVDRVSDQAGPTTVGQGVQASDYLIKRGRANPGHLSPGSVAAATPPLGEESIGISKSDQYSLIAIFSILGGSLLMSSLDLLSMYLSIELQSFALYILATLNKERLSSTSAGLKYFLLGSLSSCFILLGSAIIYSYTGLTQFEAINTLLSVPSYPLGEGFHVPGGGSVSTVPLALAAVAGEGEGLIEMLDINKAFTIGIIIIIIGFLFKISAAPFYQWAPDVYDGTPTIVTVWLTIVVKLTILIFLLGLIELNDPWLTLPEFGGLSHTHSFKNANIWGGQVEASGSIANALAQTIGGIQIKNLLLISSLLSLLIGTIAGLSQIKVKRLLAFSSISHVGFLLLALGIYTQKSVDSFIFYLVQYSITSLNIFLILLAFGYLLYPSAYGTYGAYALQQGSGTDPAEPRTGAAPKNLPSNYIHNKPSPSLRLSLAQGAAKAAAPSPMVAAVQEEADINYLIELKGQLYKNPVLSISLAICLFSMAGIPPLIGFFSKQFVLFSSIENGNNFLSIVAILVSVISASYYLRLIKITFFDAVGTTFFLQSHSGSGEGRASLQPDNVASQRSGDGQDLLTPDQAHPTSAAATRSVAATTAGASQELHRLDGKSWITSAMPNGSACYAWPRGKLYLTNFHSYTIAILTFLILFFFLDPSILLNVTQLISLTIFNL